MAKKKNKTKASAPEQNNAENSPSENVKIHDEHQVFLNVTKAYEEAKQKRENYKKKGPLFVALSGIAFLALMFMGTQNTFYRLSNGACGISLSQISDYVGNYR